MRHLQEGFLLIEILVSFLLVTSFVIMCMQCYAQLLVLKAQSLSIIEAVNEVETSLDAFNKEKHVDKIANRKFKPGSVIEPVTVPLVRGNPPGFSFKTVQHMKTITISLTWMCKSSQQCSLPLVFKDDSNVF